MLLKPNMVVAGKACSRQPGAAEREFFYGVNFEISYAMPQFSVPEKTHHGIALLI